MKTQNKVFIATSLDGFIADRNNGIAWLEMVPNPDKDDCGYNAFIAGVDALVMGRTTFDTVAGFDKWYYSKPVFVLSNTLTSLPQGFEDKAELIKGDLNEVIDTLHKRGFNNLYIDGGKTIQHFLEADLIDELIVTKLPILLGDGPALFGWLPGHLEWEHTHTDVYLGQLVQSHYKRKRS